MMSTTFVTDLHNLVNPHTVQFYSSYGPLMVSDFEARDTVQGQRVVTCVYSGENKVYTEPFDFTSNGYSREHTYAHSWMATNPAQSLPEYSDYHHLFPTNLNNANILRSNYPLGKVVTPSSTFMGCKLGLDANGKTVFEPRDEHKGDAARAMLYMTICYTTVSGNLWALPSNISSSVPYGQDQAILKTWHFNDPPSNWEIARNDYVDSLQNNRNPFIDNVDYACFVNFSNMTYESLGCEASIQDKLNTGFIAYPNPAKDELTLHVDATNISRYEVYDATGRLVLSNEVNDLVMVKVNITSLRNGNYVLKAFTPHGVAQRSISIQ
jgi:endonuclease I